jgi:hypothetical protein
MGVDLAVFAVFSSSILFILEQLKACVRLLGPPSMDGSVHPCFIVGSEVRDTG